MWMSKQIASEKQEPGTIAESGEIISASNTAMIVQGDRQYRGIPGMAPYGFSSIPPEAARVIILPVGAEAVVAGTYVDGASLSPGEVRLISAGGAEILLKNSGEVWINGQVFAPKEE